MKFVRKILAGIVGTLMTWSLVSHADRLPPWIEPGDVPLPANARSVVAIHNEVPLLARPNAGAPRRGVLATDFPMPVFAVKRGPGCVNRWLNVGPLAWVCRDKVNFSQSPPIPAGELVYNETPDGLPYRYFFVGRGGSWGHSRLRSVEVSTPDQTFEQGFAVAIIEQRENQGEMYGRTTHDVWVPMRDLHPVRATTFQGEQIRDGNLDVAWVFTNNAVARSKPSTYGRPRQKLVRFQLLKVLEEKTVGRHNYYRIGDHAWVSDHVVRKPSKAPPPKEVKQGDRWIDIHLQSQTLVAYVGDQPVYATLVSTGKGRQGTAFATPKGVHRIWVKLVASSMDNLEDEYASDVYSIEDVPYVQFFSRGVGLHATFWHKKFGRVRSHGCVNLPPLDAQWLFRFTSPHLPAGWRAVLPSDLEAATIIRVR
ncbi:MAG: L,D-transpeptidase [Sorangium cellulosum]|nr:MAG: L,D-transpeptidase [Sorangium cellulosum]